jgi:endonuclease YncB( thermonuclease family)
MPGPTVAPTALPGSRTEAVVVEVVDGDTIVVDIDGIEYRVRYIGIDTPETHHPTEGAEWLGYEATEFHRTMVNEGDTVILEKDLTETDIYGRLLRYIWVGDTHVNAEMLRSGFATTLFYPPDTKYETEFRALVETAKEKELGRWGPRPTDPAVNPIIYRGFAFLVNPSGERVVGLREDAGPGEPSLYWPAGMLVNVQSTFWDPLSESWWYYLNVDDFRGWVPEEHITRKKPGVPRPDQDFAYRGYQRLIVAPEADPLPIYATAGGPQVAQVLPPGTPVQVDRMSWVEEEGQWWYRVIVNGPDGWLLPGGLVKP